jgi:hypothetical protein
MTTLPLHGLMAEFRSPEELVRAATAAHDAGYRRMDAYSPLPVEGLEEAIGIRRPWMPRIVLAGGLTGALTGYLMQWWISAVDYPLNIGGRPYHSWPAFIPVTFELTILFGAFAAVMGMFVLNRLPQPYHPVFNVPRFRLASRNRFFLCIEAADPKFDLERTREFLLSLNPQEVNEVEP